MKEANEDYNEDGDINAKQHQRRWHIYFDNLEYISADFAVLLGTHAISAILLLYNVL